MQIPHQIIFYLSYSFFQKNETSYKKNISETNNISLDLKKFVKKKLRPFSLQQANRVFFFKKILGAWYKMMDNWQGNISTILKFIWCIIAPYIVNYMTEDQFMVIGAAVIGLIIAIWDAYNPNTFKIFKNNIPEESVPKGEVVLNDEYETEVEDDA